MRYVYIKKKTKRKHPKVVFLSTAFLMLGTLTLLWSFYPILTFNISNWFASRKNVSPVPNSSLPSSLQKGFMVYGKSMAPYYSSYLKDFTQVADWFPKHPQNLTGKQKVRNYTLSIPALGLTNKKVIVGGEDLAKSLIQYGNQIVPGQVGNPVILGHSTLPQLHRNNDYRSVFTYLPSLEKGEIITTKVNGFSYDYLVYDMYVVEAKETKVLSEGGDEATLTLITCVPPGTYWKRLVVKARLLGI